MKKKGFMLEVRELTKFYGKTPAVLNVSFTLKEGEIVGYFGPNGAGKTTTIKMLTGLLEPTSGEILYNGENIEKDIISYKEKIGYVPEESEIYPHLSGYEYLKLVGRLRGMNDKVLDEKIENLMALFNPYDSMHFYISSYSKGMRQKVLIISAIIHNPEIIFLDEPLSGLDVTSVLIMKELLKKFSFDGKIILYNSHVLDVVEKICKRVILIHRGKILADDSVENLRNLSKSPSLEEVFKNLVVKSDPLKVAEEIYDTVTG